MNEISVNKKIKLYWFDYLLIVSIFFPWLSFRSNDLDSQPWAFLACAIYLLCQRKIQYNNSFKLLFSLFLLSFVIIILSTDGDWFATTRSIIGYGQIFLVAFCAYTLKRSGKDFFSILLVINGIWLAAALLQTATNPYVLDFLVTVRTSETRGVTSLAPEPTFFAVFIITISWIIIKESKPESLNYKLKFLLFINLISIFFFSKSSMGVLYVGSIAILWSVLIATKNIRKLTLAIFSLAIFMFGFEYLMNILSGSRLYDIASKIIDSPLILIEADASVNQRVSHIYYSFGGLIDGYGIPHGINSFTEYARGMSGDYKNIFWSIPGDKIMSWAGAMFFELGFVGVLIYISILHLLWCHGDIRQNIFIIGVFFIISLAAIPHGFSPLAALIGFYAAGKSRNIVNSNVNTNQRQ